ncbi:MAG: elongation factor G [Acidimicrobiales bacterium]
MNSFPTAQVRTVALVGEAGAGKTSLAEALLFCSGAVARRGRVDDETAVLDFEPEAAKRHMSVSLGVGWFEFQGCKINILDVPGCLDFEADLAAGIAVADAAVFVVTGADEVGAGLERAWQMAASAGLARMFFVNKLDRDMSGYEATLDALRSSFGAGIAPLELPIGSGDGISGNGISGNGISGIADLLSDRAIYYPDASGACPGAAGGTTRPPQPATGAIPAEMAGIEHRVRENLVEGIVVADDDLMERYLDGDVGSPAELEATLAKGVAGASVFPVVCGSAERGVGIDRLAAFICEILPSPAAREHAVSAGGVMSQVPCAAAGPPLAQVFKTISDPYVGRISLLHVLSGALHTDDVLVNSRTRSEEKLHSLVLVRGKEQQMVPEVQAGDIAAVLKLSDTRTGDTLSQAGLPVTVAAPPRPGPALSIGIRPRSRTDDDKLSTALHKACDEDPSLYVRRDDETHQTILSGLGEVHLSVTIERLARKFSVEVETEPLAVPYRETVTAGAEAEGKYKKQTGGHGQFAVVSLKVEPTVRGTGFSFIDKVVGGAIPRQFIPAVEKGVVEAMAKGGAFGYPVVDVSVTCLDGKHHPVDSSEMSFKMAAALAFKQAAGAASPVLLEPLSLAEIIVPTHLQGEVLSDLASRRGRVQRNEPAGTGGQMTLIVALVPTSELARYGVDLRAATAGRGRFSADHSHYDVMPAQLAVRIASPGQD